MKVLKNSKGFTLAEMLIVMAVAVVLAAATIPAIGNSVEAARESNDLAALADGYVEAYTDAAVKAAAGTTGNVNKAVSITFQQTSAGWQGITSPKIAGQDALTTWSKGTVDVTYYFSISTDGVVSFSGFTAPAGS